MPGGTRWKQEKINCCVYFDRWPVCMAGLYQALESKRKRGFWYGRYRCKYFEDYGRKPSVCVSLRMHGLDGKLPLCRLRKARDEAKADLYLRYLANRAVQGLRDGLLKTAGNPLEFDRKDLWPAAIRILKEEFDGNSDIREFLRSHTEEARASIYAPPENPRAVGRGFARHDEDEGRLLPWLRSLSWPPLASPQPRRKASASPSAPDDGR